MKFHFFFSPWAEEKIKWRTKWRKIKRETRRRSVFIWKTNSKFCFRGCTWRRGEESGQLERETKQQMSFFLLFWGCAVFFSLWLVFFFLQFWSLSISPPPPRAPIIICNIYIFFVGKKPKQNKKKRLRVSDSAVIPMIRLSDSAVIPMFLSNRLINWLVQPHCSPSRLMLSMMMMMMMLGWEIIFFFCVCVSEILCPGVFSIGFRFFYEKMIIYSTHSFPSICSLWYLHAVCLCFLYLRSHIHHMEDQEKKIIIINKKKKKTRKNCK